MLLHLHSAEVGKPEKNPQCLELGKQSKGTVQTPKRQRGERRRNQNRERGRSLPSVSQVSWNWLKSWKRSARKARGFFSGALGRDSGMLQRGDAGRDGEVGAEAQGEDLDPAQSLPQPPPTAPPHPYLPNPAPAASPAPWGSSQRPSESGTRSPHGPAAAAGRAGQREAPNGGCPGPEPPPTPGRATTHLGESERHLLVHVPLHPAARALPPRPRSSRLSERTWGRHRGRLPAGRHLPRAGATSGAPPTG